MSLDANAPGEQWVVTIIGAIEINAAQIEVITTEAIGNLGHVLVEAIACSIGRCIKGEQLVLVGVDAVRNLVGMQFIPVNVFQVDVEVEASVATLVAAIEELQCLGIGGNCSNSLAKRSVGRSPLDGCQRTVVAPNACQAVSQQVVGIGGRGIAFRALQGDDTGCVIDSIGHSLNTLVGSEFHPIVIIAQVYQGVPPPCQNQAVAVLLVVGHILSQGHSDCGAAVGTVVAQLALHPHACSLAVGQRVEQIYLVVIAIDDFHLPCLLRSFKSVEACSHELSRAAVGHDGSFGLLGNYLHIGFDSWFAQGVNFLGACAHCNRCNKGKK